MSSVLLPVLGCELWNLDSSNTKRLLHLTWRRGFRKGLDLPKSTSLTETFECEDKLVQNQQLLFYWSMSHYQNPLVEEFIFNIGRDSRTPSSGWNRANVVMQRQIRMRYWSDWLRSGVT